MSKKLDEAYLEALDKIADLEARLAEKEKAYQELLNSIKIKDLSNINFIQVNDDIVRFSKSGVLYEYNQKENKVYKIIDQAHQDKISFCIEQLEKVKNKFNGKRPIDDLANEVGLELGYTATQIQKYIDNQIEELKKDMKYEN